MTPLAAVLPLLALLQLASVQGQAFWLPDHVLFLSLPQPALDGIQIFRTVQPEVVITGKVAGERGARAPCMPMLPVSQWVRQQGMHAMLHAIFVGPMPERLPSDGPGRA